MRLLNEKQVTTIAGTYLPLGDNITEVSICCHSDTPVRLHLLLRSKCLIFSPQGAVEIAQMVKQLVDESNKAAGFV
jgi:lactam utilization protein B